MKTIPNKVLGNRSLPAWRKAGHRFYSYNYFLRQRYGFRVQKVSIDAAFQKYKVVIDPESLSINFEETETLRQEAKSLKPLG